MQWGIIKNSAGPYQAFQSFGNNGCESLLSCELRYEEDIFRSRDLVWSVGSPCVWTTNNRSRVLVHIQSRRHHFIPNHMETAQRTVLVDIYWPNCCMALSALHGSSSVMWTLRRWFFTRRSACREIPELAASEMMAMFWLERHTTDISSCFFYFFFPSFICH